MKVQGEVAERERQRFGNWIVTQCLQQTRVPVWACRCEVTLDHVRGKWPPRPFSVNAAVKMSGTDAFGFHFVLAGFHCPLCSKFMASDEIEKHLLICFSKTRLTYNSRDSCCYFSSKKKETNQISPRSSSTQLLVM